MRQTHRHMGRSQGIHPATVGGADQTTFERYLRRFVQPKLDLHVNERPLHSTPDIDRSGSRFGWSCCFYAIETWKIRKATQKQVQASNDQVEGLSKPCITFPGSLRDGADTILEMHGATGNIIAAADTGSYIIVNIGSGVALNIRYQFTRQERQPVVRYIPNLSVSAKASLIESVNHYNAEHHVTFITRA